MTTYPAKLQDARGRDSSRASRRRAFRGLYVYTGPVLEREWGMRAGLGWIVRHAPPPLGARLLLPPGRSLHTELELRRGPLPADIAQLHAVPGRLPTGALEPTRWDPRLLSISPSSTGASRYRNLFRARSRELGSSGCDLLSGGPARGRPRARPAGTTALVHPLLPLPSRLEPLRIPPSASSLTAFAPARSAAGLLRNVAFARRQHGNPAAIPSLTAALARPEPLRCAGARRWASARLAGQRRSPETALGPAPRRESDAVAAAPRSPPRARRSRCTRSRASSSPQPRTFRGYAAVIEVGAWGAPTR